MGENTKIEKPILFTDEMVRAILGGQKTVTRRTGPTWAGVQPGTVLWVRECHAIARKNYWHDWEVDRDPDVDEPEQPTCMEAEEVYYRATPRVGLRRWVGPTAPAPDDSQGQPHHMTWLHESTPLSAGPAARVKRWRPYIHMPRWACRLTLEVVSVTRELADECGNTCVETIEDRVRCVLNHCPKVLGCLRVPSVTDEEARREGFASRAAFIALWNKLHPGYLGVIYRVEFRVLEASCG